MLPSVHWGAATHATAELAKLQEVAVRNRLLALGLAIVVGAVAGCSSSGTQSSSPQSSVQGEKVTLTYGIWDKNQVPAMEKIASAFTESHPNVSVSVQVTPFDSYFTKLQAAATGGQAPDVFWLNGPNFQLYASNGVLQEVKVDAANYPASLVNLYQYNGKQYGVPKDFDTIGLWYNKKLFDAAKVDYPTADWKWADVQDAAKKLTDPAKGVYGIGAPPSGQENFYNTVFQAGGFIISPDGKRSGYDDPKTIAGLKFWTDLVQAHYSPSMQQMTDTVPLQMFEAGKLAMLYSGSWNATEFAKNTNTKNNVDVAQLPAGEKKATVIHGLGNVVFAKGPHTAEAAAFAEFLGSKQAADTQASTGTVIPAFNGTQQAWVKAFPQYHLQNFLDEVSYAVPYPISKNTAVWNGYETDELTKAWSGSESVEQAAKNLAAKMNEALVKESK
jgi:multiple sugar transport system substrate-binding protein